MRARRCAVGAATGLGLVWVVFLLAAPSCENEGGILGPAPTFSRIDFDLMPVSSASVSWGDYDNDGDLDLALAGAHDEDPEDPSAFTYVSKIYRNDSAAFRDIGAGLTGICGSLAWGDHDGDGWLDLALAGWHGLERVSEVYRNDAGTLTATGTDPTGFAARSLAWGDYDNDGDLDLVLSGSRSYSDTTELYRNDGAAFTDAAAGFPAASCQLAWGDYDSDGDLDLILAHGPVTIYRNDDSTFSGTDPGLPRASSCSLAWGDYDTDGDLDLALAGRGFLSIYSKVFRNDDAALTDIAAGLMWTVDCSLAWGDYDNDGDLDLALAGDATGGNYFGGVYRNDAGAFVDIGVDLPSVSYCSLAWGDFDSDGDLDLAIAGRQRAEIYRNNCKVRNRPPSPPTALSHSVSGSAPVYDVTFSWDPSTDDHTPTPGLTYNLRVWTDDGSVIHEVMPGMADPVTGRRLIPAMGNCQHAGPVAAPRRSWTLHLPAGTYYCTVQAVDTAFAGSAWGEEQTVTVP